MKICSSSFRIATLPFWSALLADSQRAWYGDSIFIRIIVYKSQQHLFVRSDGEDDSARELTALHAVVHRLEVRERLDRDLSLYLAASSKVERLDGVLTVADVRTRDLREGSGRYEERGGEGDVRGEP